uniref:Protein eyes shut homolog n=1 Tax=Dicentrarchus labrax TaxID=13489 RepID=A0A8P4KTZ8_DICLA
MGAPSFHLIAVFVAVHMIHCQRVCNRQASLEWHLKQHAIKINWTLVGNICRSVSECWDSHGGEESIEHPFNFPQICPLQLQHGDKLLMSADETLKSYGIRLLNVSKDSFESCSTNRQMRDQFLFPHNIDESEQVEAKWLVPGHHYFIALHEGDTQLCKLGLRLNVSVKAQLCQASPLLRLCSGNGICQTGLWEGAYHCRCHHQYSGRFCEKSDACLDNPCENKGVCLSNGSTDPNHRTYKCLCPPHFTGKDKTPQIPFVENDGVCEERHNGFVCHCPERFGGLYCDSRLDFDCMLYACQEEQICTAGECLRGFSGKNCEEIIDYCRLLNINCLNEGLCLKIIGGYQVKMMRGCIVKSWLYFLTRMGSIQDISIQDEAISFLYMKQRASYFMTYAANSSIFYQQPCANGGRCVLNTASSYTCICTPGWSGQDCRINVNDCVQHWCQNGATCVDEIDGYSCLCPRGYTGIYCEEDIDYCVGRRCSEHGVCLDQQYNFTCRCMLGFEGSLCELETNECNSFPCASGATCVDLISDYRCHCPPGFEGTKCELDIDECASSPCKNGATCIDQPGNYFCQCVAPFKVVDGFYCLCNPGYAGLRCEQDIDDCVNSLCSTNSICKDLHLSYECVCHSGWEGEFCQQEIDECLSQPCKNNATCTDLLNSYKCLCSSGWTGVDCAEDMNECDSGPCLNGAQCQESDVPGEFSCTCPPFFSGPLCNQPYDPCDPLHNPCLNNSTCLTRSNGTCYHISLRFHCICPPGYYGTLCDLDVNECEVSPCLHEGICINTPGGFKCVCRPGYSGKLIQNICSSNACKIVKYVMSYLNMLHFLGARCDVNIDECVSNPCQNSGRCIDAPDRYDCLCPDGFTGLHCETNIDECMSAPCLHGSCMDGIYSHSCLCESGWTGTRCETNIDDCASSPCLNGGSCVDLIDKYACFCQDGYTGKTCENDIDVCKDATYNVSLCFNGATCVDGEGSNFTCSCPPGFMGDFCEVDVNECCSAPCHNGAICQDLINSYVCHCRSGWTGLHCEDDINECLPQPCNQGICIQNDPGYGYTCFCPFSCVDGINKVSCLPPVTDAVPLATIVENITRGSTPRVPTPTLSPAPTAVQSTGTDHTVQACTNTYVHIHFMHFIYSSLSHLSKNTWLRLNNSLRKRINRESAEFTVKMHKLQSVLLLFTLFPTFQISIFFYFLDSSYVQYFGNSYLEFEGFDLSTLNNITVRFQTRAARGTILYVDQGPANSDFFFMKLFILDGLLQVKTQVEQHLTPCEAELTLSGHKKIKSTASNYWLGHMMQRLNHVFTGGLPQQYIPNQVTKPFHNYTGCIEVIEINKRRSFYTSDAIAGSNIDRLSTTTMAAPTQTPKHPLREPQVCRDGFCRNGGTCHPLQLPGGALPSCHCPLHFTGTFCEKDTTIYIPSFDGTSYLELQPLASLLQPSGASNNLPATVKDTNVILYLTVKTRSTQGTILYTQEQNFGDQFLHVFLQDGSPVAKLGCGGSHVLNAAAGQNINNNRWIPITIRYNLPVGKQGGSCMIEIAADNGTVHRLEEYVSHPVTQGTFGPIFLGDVSSHWEMHDGGTKGARRFIGCIRELQVNSKEIYLVGEAVRGRNIKNCDPPVCQHLPCRNGGTCVSDAEDWFCECPPLYTGRLCQFNACERNPCGHGATCIPKSPLEAVCLCPYGRQGLLCDEPINITRARFSGSDEFGYTSFMAYSSIPSISFFYEFKLKFTLANNSSAVKDNLMLFAGHKGQGNDGDDFFVLGLRNGRVVHKFNLGSGIATIVSDRLNHQINIHTVTFGRSKKTGWLKVDGQRNRTGSSPGPLSGLNVFNQLFVGGYNEYTPELLPLGSRFRHGFQGCIFDVQFCTRRDRKFQVLGQPAGHPAFGRSVGQCGVTPCVHVHCRNGGTCVDSGSSVYCQCPLGWKGALCSETVSVCDVEHSPPPLCAHGSTCIPLPNGYTCQCPLGTAGLYCEKAVTISDPFFSGNQSSWMSFPPMSIRHRTVLQLQFQPLSPDGILVYTAQHLSARAGDFFCLSLTSGFVRLTFNLGDGTHILRSVKRVDTRGRTWHTVKAGRFGHQGFLSLDNEEVRENGTEGMTTLDVTTDIFVGGVSTLSYVSTEATEGEPMGYTGGLRELIVNGQELELTETWAISGANVGDWDGTACGYKVCQNGGRCLATGRDSFTCVCLPSWTGSVCNQSVSCVNNSCKHGSLCAPSSVTSYRCICPLGWGGKYCDTEIATDTLKFVGNSYVKYQDPRYSTRNFKYTRVSFSFNTSSNDSLIMWMGKAEHEDDDYLTVGIESGHLKIAVNLGERLSLPITFRNLTLCYNIWHNVSVSLNGTVIQVLLNNKRILFEDVDPFERYVALNYGGQLYFGGFELHRNVSIVTSGLFSKAFEGNLRNVYLFKDTKPLLLLKDGEGFNVYDGNE